jgi:hypothetical protein
MFQLIRSEVFSHPILLFCKEDLIVKLAAEGIEHLLVEQMELDELRRLNLKLTSGCYPLLVTSDPDVMRGYDFRSQKVGMILCIAKSFASMRDANQGMGRVGRFGESAQRFKLQSVSLVDDVKN